MRLHRWGVADGDRRHGPGSSQVGFHGSQEGVFLKGFPSDGCLDVCRSRTVNRGPKRCDGTAAVDLGRPTRAMRRHLLGSDPAASSEAGRHSDCAAGSGGTLPWVVSEVVVGHFPGGFETLAEAGFDYSVLLMGWFRCRRCRQQGCPSRGRGLSPISRAIHGLTEVGARNFGSSKRSMSKLLWAHRFRERCA